MNKEFFKQLARIIPINTITVPEGRVRNFDDPAEAKDLSKLQASIMEAGLIMPVLIHSNGDLIAGERRMRAISQISTPYSFLGKPVPPRYIPVIVAEGLSEAERLRLEIYENKHRRNVSPVDEARATARLFSLLEAERERAIQAAESPEEAPPKLMLDEFITEVNEREPGAAARKEIQQQKKVDAYLEMYPNEELMLRQQSSLKGMERYVDQMMANREQVAQAARTPKNPDLNFIHGNAIEVLKTLPAKSFDCIIMDPPYGTNRHKDKSRGELIQQRDFDDSPEETLALIKAVADQFPTICKEKAHLYCFCDITMFQPISTVLLMSGFSVFKRPLIWNKNGRGPAGHADYEPSRTYECIIFGNRGPKPWPHKQPSDLITCTPSQDKSEHPDRKPAQLYAELLSQSCTAGDSVLDPFCGAGTVFEAAQQLQLYATGIELSERYAPAAQRKTLYLPEKEIA